MSLTMLLPTRTTCKVTAGSATLEGEDLLELEPEERAAAGLFLAFQYPVEIPKRQPLPPHHGDL